MVNEAILKKIEETNFVADMLDKVDLILKVDRNYSQFWGMCYIQGENKLFIDLIMPALTEQLMYLLPLHVKGFVNKYKFAQKFIVQTYDWAAVVSDHWLTSHIFKLSHWNFQFFFNFIEIKFC